MGAVVPGLLPGSVIRVGLGGADVKVFDLFLGADLSLGSFFLAIEKSSLATCLAAATPRLSEPDPCLVAT